MKLLDKVSDRSKVYFHLLINITGQEAKLVTDFFVWSKDEDLLERILDQDTKYREEYYKKYLDFIAPQIYDYPSKPTKDSDNNI